MSTNKKILIGASILTLIIVIGGFTYILSHKGTATTLVNNSGSPFGNGGGAGTGSFNPNDNSLDVTGVSTQVKTVGQLREISATPVSGATFMAPNTATSTDTTTPVANDETVAFIERATGHLFSADLASGNISRLTNDTLPKIEEVAWGASGSNALVQSLDDGSIDTSFIQLSAPDASNANATGTATSTGTGAALQIYELQPNILTMAIDPAGDQLFYILHGTAGAQGFVSDMKGDNAAPVWQFPTDEWNASWPAGTTIYLTSKASNGAPGYIYGINAKTKASTLLVDNVPGLSALPSPSGDKIFYTSITGSNAKAYLYDVKSGTSVPIAIATLAEKCIWAPDETALYCGVPRALSANAPDDWYQGTVSYSDDLWKADLGNGNVSQVAVLASSADAVKGTMDLIDPAISADGSTITFVNKKDLSLWAVNISGQ